MRKKLKGFTLIELIIVMAIFGVIMAAAVGLMSPVGEVFSSTAKYEQTRSAIDNIDRYLKGTVRYADRLSMYVEYNDNPLDPDNGTVQYEITEDNIRQNVIQFAGEHFYCGSISDSLTDPKNTPINVLVFDNTNYKIYQYTVSPPSGSTWKDVLSYDSTTNTYSSASISLGSQTNPINDALFETYSFRVYLGSYEYVYSESSNDTIFTPQNYGSDFPTCSSIAFTIDAFKNVSSGEPECLKQATSLSFGLINIMNSDGTSSNEEIRYYDSTNLDFKTINVPRSHIYPDSEDEQAKVVKSSSNFYIIYTMPERADEYQSEYSGKTYNYTVSTTTTATSTT